MLVRGSVMMLMMMTVLHGFVVVRAGEKRKKLKNLILTRSCVLLFLFSAPLPHCISRNPSCTCLREMHFQHPPFSCKGSSCSRGPLAGQSVFRAAAKAAWPTAAAWTVMAAAAGPADAKSSSRSNHPPRVQAVLDWLAHNPMTVSSLAMQYDAEPTTPLPECIQGLSPADVVPAQQHASSEMAKVIAGLLYAACGGLDQAHNLVTPLCWGSWTPYAGNKRFV